jgi:glutathione S-transferase
MPNYTLHYFNGRGRAELIRLIFTAAGASFTDHRIHDWPATKAETPLGQLPFLTVDDVQLPQSMTIARFVAREQNLAGRTSLEQVMLIKSFIETVKSHL